VKYLIVTSCGLVFIYHIAFTCTDETDTNVLWGDWKDEVLSITGEVNGKLLLMNDSPLRLGGELKK